MHQQPRTIDPPGKPKSSSRSLHVCSVSGRTSNMAAVWHSAAHGTRPASVALCGKTNPSHLFQPCICGLVRKDAAVDPSAALCGKANPSPLFQPRICGLVPKDAAGRRICGFVRRDEPLPPIPAPHLWPCAERRGRRPHPWLCAERRTPPCPNRPTSVVLCGKTASPESHEDLAVACPGGIARDQLEPDPQQLLPAGPAPDARRMPCHSCPADSPAGGGPHLLDGCRRGSTTSETASRCCRPVLRLDPNLISGTSPSRDWSARNTVGHGSSSRRCLTRRSPSTSIASPVGPSSTRIGPACRSIPSCRVSPPTRRS